MFFFISSFDFLLNFPPKSIFLHYFTIIKAFIKFLVLLFNTRLHFFLSMYLSLAFLGNYAFSRTYVKEYIQK